MDLQLDVATCGEYTVVSVDGDVDMMTAGQLDTELVGLLRGGDRELVLDLRKVEFMDSAGLSVLVSANRRAGLLGGSFRLAAPCSTVARVLAVSCLDRAVAVFATIEEALTARLPRTAPMPSF
jgi:anti-anti-sigma factor